MTRIIIPIEVLADALRDILEMAQDREDVEDREDGGVRPNAWMDVATLAREALEAAGMTP